MNNSFLSLKQDFPIFNQLNRGKPLVYLDSAASTQKPHAVIKSINDFYCESYANIHRGVYELSEKATFLYENVRSKVKHLINAPSEKEIVFVRGTTEGINLLASSFSQNFLQSGDEIIISELEHHSNIVPWVLLSQRLGVKLNIIPMNNLGELDLAAYAKFFNARTKLVSVSHVSNALGTINPIKKMISIAHENNVPIIIDGAQSVGHMPVDVQLLDCDFYVFSAHKLYGPTGAGIVFGKKSWLERLPPYQGGGDMIETVAFDKITFAPIPHKFEAGTPDIAAVVGMGAAIDYVTALDMQKVYEHEQQLLKYATQLLKEVPGLRLIGQAQQKVGVLSFILEDIHPHDIASILDHEGVAIRAGHHCAMPVMKKFSLPATVRASLGIYNNNEDIDTLIKAIYTAKRLFQ